MLDLTLISYLIRPDSYPCITFAYPHRLPSRVLFRFNAKPHFFAQTNTKNPPPFLTPYNFTYNALFVVYFLHEMCDVTQGTYHRRVFI